MKARSSFAARAVATRRGFTLIEILAVLVILGILSALLITQLTGGREAADIEATRRLLARLEATVEHYEREFGDAPTSRFRADEGVANDGLNVGGEALVVRLWSNGFEAGGLLEDVADLLVNVDGDRSAGALTDFPSRALFEVPDAWGNPIAYLHRQDYAQAAHEYLTLDPRSGETLRSFVKAFRNEATGRYVRSAGFQLVSAGPDGLFDTEDDVTTFAR